MNGNCEDGGEQKLAWCRERRRGFEGLKDTAADR